MTEDQARAFYDFLQGGDAPDGIRLSVAPHLTQAQAAAVIYVLQEGYHLIPDHYECCAGCGYLFDTHNAGGSLDEDVLAGQGLQLRDPDYAGLIVCDNCWETQVQPAPEE